MMDTMTIGELISALHTAVDQGADPNQPFFAGDPDDPETIDGITFHVPSNSWHLNTSPAA